MRYLESGVINMVQLMFRMGCMGCMTMAWDHGWDGMAEWGIKLPRWDISLLNIGGAS